MRSSVGLHAVSHFKPQRLQKVIKKKKTKQKTKRACLLLKFWIHAATTGNTSAVPRLSFSSILPRRYFSLSTAFSIHLARKTYFWLYSRFWNIFLTFLLLFCVQKRNLVIKTALIWLVLGRFFCVFSQSESICNLHSCYKFCTSVTKEPHSFLRLSELSNFFVYIIYSIKRKSRRNRLWLELTV